MVQHENTITKMILKLILQATFVVLAVSIVMIDAELLEQGKNKICSLMSCSNKYEL